MQPRHQLSTQALFLSNGTPVALPNQQQRQKQQALLQRKKMRPLVILCMLPTLTKRDARKLSQFPYYEETLETLNMTDGHKPVLLLLRGAN